MNLILQWKRGSLWLLRVAEAEAKMPSGRMVGKPEVIQKRASRKLAGLVPRSRLFDPNFRVARDSGIIANLGRV
jgi:hypothetical protein